MVLVGVTGSNAQTLTSIGVEKFQDYTQTSATTPSVVTGYHFNLAIDGDSLDSLPGSLTPPTGPGIVIAPLAPVYFGPYADFSFTGSGPLPTLGDGTYNIAIDGHGAGVDLSGSLYPGYVPTVSGSGLTWSGGSLVVNAGIANTFDFNIVTSGFATDGYAEDSLHPFGGSVTFLISDLSGTLINGISSAAAFDGATPVDSFTLDAFSLTSGTTYNATLEFNVVADIKTDIASDLTDTFGGAAYALYGNQTHFTITAVPEPANVAAFLALAALLTVAAQRRSRRLSVAG